MTISPNRSCQIITGALLYALASTGIFYLATTHIYPYLNAFSFAGQDASSFLEMEPRSTTPFSCYMIFALGALVGVAVFLVDPNLLQRKSFPNGDSLSLQLGRLFVLVLTGTNIITIALPLLWVMVELCHIAAAHLDEIALPTIVVVIGTTMLGCYVCAMRHVTKNFRP